METSAPDGRWLNDCAKDRHLSFLFITTFAFSSLFSDDLSWVSKSSWIHLNTSILKKCRTNIWQFIFNYFQINYLNEAKSNYKRMTVIVLQLHLTRTRMWNECAFMWSVWVCWRCQSKSWSLKWRYFWIESWEHPWFRRPTEPQLVLWCQREW